MVLSEAVCRRVAHGRLYLGARLVVVQLRERVEPRQPNARSPVAPGGDAPRLCLTLSPPEVPRLSLVEPVAVFVREEAALVLDTGEGRGAESFVAGECGELEQRPRYARGSVGESARRPLRG